MYGRTGSKTRWTLLSQVRQHAVWSIWSSRILSTFAQSNLLVTHGNVSNIKSALQNNFLKMQRFGHRSLAHPFWPEVNPEVLIKAIILSKYRKQQAMKHEMVSFLVSYPDFQTWDGGHMYSVIACYRPSWGLLLTLRSFLACWTHWHGGLARCHGTELGLSVIGQPLPEGCTEETVTASWWNKPKAPWEEWLKIVFVWNPES